MTSLTNQLPKSGGYKTLRSFAGAKVIYDLTVKFVEKYVDPKSRTCDQMVQAARSGKQNIAEGSVDSAASKQSEIKLVQIARGSLQELLEDYEDFLRHKNLPLWSKDDARAIEVRKLVYKTSESDVSNMTNGSHMSDGSYKTYLSYLENAESAANSIICLIHQTNYLLDQQLKALRQDFVNTGDVPEQMRDLRNEHKKYEMFGGKDDGYDELIASFGMRRLENGRVVKINTDESNAKK